MNDEKSEETIKKLLFILKDLPRKTVDFKTSQNAQLACYMRPMLDYRTICGEGLGMNFILIKKR